MTGTIAGESRATAEKKLREAGAIVHSSLSKTTDLVVTGANVGQSKVNKALARGIEIRPWDYVWRGAAPADAWEEVQPPPAEEQALVARQIGPMLAKAADELPSGRWSYEVKWDGLRCIATVKDGRVSMQSRSGKSDYVRRFPAVARALAKLPDCVIDGELMPSWTVPGLVAFDLIGFDPAGLALMQWPLRARRELLKPLVEMVGPELQLSKPFDDPEAAWAFVSEHGLEGVVAKQLDGPYVEGGRQWIKVKLRLEQELLVLGWVPGKGARAGGVGGLLLGYYDDDGWIVYAGKVGGKAKLDDEFRALFRPGLTPVWMPQLEAELRRETTWVEPVVMVTVAFQKWTEDGRLWHPTLKAIRENDKDPRDVRREV